MKFLTVSFLVLVVCANLSADQAFAQRSTTKKQYQAANWSAFFPKIAGCVRVIQPLERNGAVFEKTAVYERQGYKIKKNEYYVGCGSITLRFDPEAKKSAAERFKWSDPTLQKIQIGTFDAYRGSPLCGNDDFIGSTDVYFDEDKVLIARAYVGAEKILDFPPIADYESIKKSMNKLVRNKSRQKSVIGNR